MKTLPMVFGIMSYGRNLFQLYRQVRLDTLRLWTLQEAGEIGLVAARVRPPMSLSGSNEASRAAGWRREVSGFVFDPYSLRIC
jgi:hypothetical protein